MKIVINEYFAVVYGKGKFRVYSNPYPRQKTKRRIRTRKTIDVPT